MIVILFMPLGCFITIHGTKQLSNVWLRSWYLPSWILGFIGYSCDVLRGIHFHLNLANSSIEVLFMSQPCNIVFFKKKLCLNSWWFGLWCYANKHGVAHLVKNNMAVANQAMTTIQSLTWRLATFMFNWVLSFRFLKAS